MPELREYQREAVDAMGKYPTFLLADDMGLGKSASSIAASEGKTLVIAPAMVVDSGTWRNEIEKWADDPSRFEVTAYSRLARKDRLLGHVDQHWDTLILDEAHYCKNPKAARTMASRVVAKQSDKVLMLTGTPVPNYLPEVFSILQILFPEEAKSGGRFGSLWRWREEWFNCRPNPFNPRAIDIVGLKGCSSRCPDQCIHYHRFMDSNFRGRFLSRNLADVDVELPPLIEQTIEIPMVPAQQKAYTSTAKDWVADVGETEIVNWSAAANHITLDRITTGLHTLQPNMEKDASNKMDMLREDLQNRSGPTLVVANYINTLDSIAGVCTSLGLSHRVVFGKTTKQAREEAVRDFQDGKLDVLVGQIEVLAEGLTLTAADMAILVESSYRSTTMKQVVKRIHRLGQDKTCYIRKYVSVQKGKTKNRPTVDGRKQEILANKNDIARRAINATKLKEYLGV